MIDRYKNSLKMPQAEELLDLVFFRPIGFFLAHGISRTRITPNQVTAASLVAGLAAAYFFALGRISDFIVAGVFLVAANIFDCADGQLARLQNSGTLLGRVIDGVADYISTAAMFVGIGIGLHESTIAHWMIVAAALASSGLHGIVFDVYQSEFMANARGESSFIDAEEQRFTEEIHRLGSEHSWGVRSVLTALYLRYLRLQKQFRLVHHRNGFDPHSYQRANAVMIRLWSFLGPTTNRTFLICCAFLNELHLFLWAVLILGNGWLLICTLLQRRITRRLVAATVVRSAVLNGSK